MDFEEKGVYTTYKPMSYSEAVISTKYCMAIYAAFPARLRQYKTNNAANA